MSTIGLIICAGNQKRFKNKTQKALMKINSKPLLDYNINVMSKYCDQVFVVCSFNNQEAFKDYNKITIKSGLGCGDAVYKAIRKFKTDDKAFILWGDSYVPSFVYSKILESDKSGILVPCEYSDNPYVQILEKNGGKLSVKFSKFNDEVSSGYHDLSLFYGQVGLILSGCYHFRELFYNIENDSYNINEHNNEFNFLDIFNFSDVYGNIIYDDKFKSVSFNTEKEFYDLGEIDIEDKDN